MTRFMTASMRGLASSNRKVGSYQNTTKSDHPIDPIQVRPSVYPKHREITGTLCLGDAGTAS